MASAFCFETKRPISPASLRVRDRRQGHPWADQGFVEDLRPVIEKKAGDADSKNA